MEKRARPTTITSTPRPRNRKAQIVAAAGDLFYRQGYHNVSTGQIADSVGITAGALYRHFDSKQDLLAHALIDAFDQALTFVQDEAPADLDAMVHGLATTAGTRRPLGVLWNREARHLDVERRTLIRSRFFAFLSQFNEHLGVSRPELTAADAELLSWSALGVLTSPSYHSTAMDSPAIVDLLQKVTVAVCSSPIESRNAAHRVEPEQAGGLRSTNRRESILAAATQLFYKHSYPNVSMDEIGAEVGMTSAGVYKYFDSKGELLSAVITRASEPLQLGLTGALNAARTPAEGLNNALDAYIDFAMVHHDLVGILISEVTNLPESQRHNVRRAQRDYAEEWIRLLSDSRPELQERQARFLVHAVLAIVNDVTRTSQMLQRPALGEELRMIGRRALSVDL